MIKKFFTTTILPVLWRSLALNLAITTLILAPINPSYGKKNPEYPIAMEEVMASKNVPSHVDRWDVAKMAWTGAKSALFFSQDYANESAEEGIREISIPLYNWLTRFYPDERHKTKKKADVYIKKKSTESLVPYTGQNDNPIDLLINQSMKFKNSSYGKNLEKILKNTRDISIYSYYIIASIVSIICAVLIISSATPYTSEIAIVALIVGVLTTIPMIVVGGSLVIYKALKVFLNRIIELRRDRIIFPKRYAFLKRTCQNSLDDLEGYLKKMREFSPCPIFVKYNKSKSCYQLKASGSTMNLTGLKNSYGQILEHMAQRSELNLENLKRKPNALLNLDESIEKDKDRQRLGECLAKNDPPRLRTNFFMMAAISSRTSQYGLSDFRYVEMPPKQELRSQKTVLGAVTGHFKPSRNVANKLTLQRSDVFDFIGNGSMPYQNRNECRQKVKKKLDHLTLPISQIMNFFFDILQGFLKKSSDKFGPKINNLLDTIKKNAHKFENPDELMKIAESIYNKLPESVKKYLFFETLVSLAKSNIRDIQKMANRGKNVFLSIAPIAEAPKKMVKEGKEFLKEQLHHFDAYSPTYLEDKSREICKDYHEYVGCRVKINDKLGEIHKVGRQHEKRWKKKTGTKGRFTPFLPEGDSEAKFIIENFAPDK